MRNQTKSNPETSAPAPTLRTDRICLALERLRFAALAFDTAPGAKRSRSTSSARSALSRALKVALRYFRRGAAFAEIALEGREPEVGVAFLLLEMDKAAIRLLGDPQPRDSSRPHS